MVDENKKAKIKKILSVIGTIFTVLIFLLAAYVLVNMVVCRIKNKPVMFFGYSFAIVQTGSMEPTIMTGDLIVFQSVDYDDIEVGDIIVFVGDENFGNKEGETIVHRVVEITESGLVTQGDNNSTADDGVREVSEVYGICVSNSATWGKIFSFLGTFGVLILILVIAVPIIVHLIIRIVRLAKDGDNNNDSEDEANNQIKNGIDNIDMEVDRTCDEDKGNTDKKE